MGRERQSRRLEVESTGSGRPRHWVGDRFLERWDIGFQVCPRKLGEPGSGEEKSKVESRIREFVRCYQVSPAIRLLTLGIQSRV